MANDCTGHRSGLRDNEELGHVDYASEKSGLIERVSAEGLQIRVCCTWEPGVIHTIIIITHRLTGTSVHVGKVSTNGMTYRSMNAASGAWLKSNCILFIWSFL